MNIKFKVCSCQKDRIHLWQSFVKHLENNLKRKIKLLLFKKFPEDLEDKTELFYSSFSLSLHLFKRNYKPIAKLRGHEDVYLIVGNKHLEIIKSQEKIEILIINRSIFYYLLFYLVLELNLDFSKIFLKIKDSWEEIIEELINKRIDLVIIPYKKIKEHINKFSYIKEFPLKVSHYFMCSLDTPLISQIKSALLSLDKLVINQLGFEGIEEINFWEEEIIKFAYYTTEFVEKFVEKCTILDTLLNFPYFGIFVYHKTFLYANKYFCDFLEYSLEELKKITPLDVTFYEEIKPLIKERIERRLKGEYFFQPYEKYVFKTKTGKKKIGLMATNTIIYQGKYCGFGVVIDITKEKKLEKFAKLLNNINSILITCEQEKEFYERILPIIYQFLELKYLLISKVDKEKGILQPIFWYPENTGILKNLIVPLDIQDPLIIDICQNKKIFLCGDINNCPKNIKNLVKNLGINSFCVIPLTKNNEIISVLTLLSEEKEFFEEELIEVIKELQQNLSFALKKLELIEKDYILRKFIEKTDEIIIICDEKGKIEYITPFSKYILGLSEKDILEKNCFKMLYIPPEIIKSKKDTVRLTIYHRADGQRLLLEFKMVFIILPDGATKVVILAKDLTKELEFEEEKERLQYQDFLTGFLNRRGFTKRVSNLLNILNRPSILLLIDFYNFSYINHFYGFEVGDFCLKEISKRLEEILEDRGMIGRTGGDEFALFIIDVTHEDIGEWLRKIKFALDKPLKYREKKLSLEYNIGLTVFPYDGEDFETLWRKVNLVLVEAKRKGPNIIEIFNPEIEARTEEVFKTEILIKKAFDEDLFIFYYQPIFEIETLKIAGVEALVRIKGDTNLVLPAQFIKYLEESSYLIEFENFCFEKNIKKIKEWGIPVSINISSQSFKTLDFKNIFTSYEDILVEFPNYLQLEITEHTLAENIEMAKNIIENIKFFKVKIALDDFGTGYSSLNYLKDFPIDVLKIDISFIKEMVNDIKTYHIVRSIIQLAQLLGIETVAEGVETEEQLRFLRDLGCQYVQGFYLCKPLPENEIEKLIKKKS